MLLHWDITDLWNFYSDYRSTVAPSDSDRDCPSRRDSESSHRAAQNSRLAPANDSESGGSHSPSPRASRKRQVWISWGYDINMIWNWEYSLEKLKILWFVRTANFKYIIIGRNGWLQRVRNHSLTSLCLLSHHPFFSIFRECLFILKRLIDACNENSSPRRVGASRQINRWNSFV